MVVLKSRPRRHTQTSKSSKLAWLIVIAFVLLLGMVAVGWVSARSFLRGPQFRVLVEKETGDLLKTTGTYLPFQWFGNQVYSDGYAGNGTQGSAVNRIKADQIRAEFDFFALFDRRVRIPAIGIQRLELNLAEPARHPESPVRNTSGGGAPKWWQPREFQLDSLRVESGDVSWPGGRYSGGRLEAAPKGGGLWDFSGRGGTLRIAGLPELRIEQALCRLNTPLLHVVDARASLEGKGILHATGTVDTAQKGASDLNIGLEAVPAAPFLPDSITRYASGNVSGNLVAKHSATQQLVEGELSLAGGVLKGLPVLDRIARFTRTERFRELTLQECKGHLKFEHGDLQVTKMIVESQGLIRAEGGFRIVKGMIDGTFEVGVAPSTLRWIPGAQGKVFTIEKEGYVWTTMRVTGPVEKPSEDLSPRLAAAVPEAIIENVLDRAGGVEGAIKEGAQGVLDLLLPR